MARKIPVLPGYTYLGGSARRYRDPEGNEISRRQYEDERLRRIGWKNWTDYQNTKRRNDQWIRDQGIYTRKQGIKKRDVGPDSEFARAYLAARKDKGKDRYRHDGPLHDYLVLVGLRKEDDYWDVGDTPTLSK